MPGPRFDYIPIIGDPAKADLRVAFISGISTAQGSRDTDGGRLYGEVVMLTAGEPPLPYYHVSFYNDVSRVEDKEVLTGTTQNLNEYFDLNETNGSGMAGQAILRSHTADYRGLILVPTFATDVDVYTSPSASASLPGYDAEYGLAYLHAQAMREIMTTGLPGAVPALFGGDGLATFVPTDVDAELPDLRQIASVDNLRVAQVNLVKALGAEQAEGVEGWMKVAENARKRYDAVMERLAALNTKDEEEAAEELESSGGDIGVTTFARI